MKITTESGAENDFERESGSPSRNLSNKNGIDTSEQRNEISPYKESAKDSKFKSRNANKKVS